MRTAVAAALAVLSLAALPGAPQGQDEATGRRDFVFAEVNRLRKESISKETDKPFNLPPLAFHAKLQAAAQAHAEAMAKAGRASDRLDAPLVVGGKSVADRVKEAGYTGAVTANVGGSAPQAASDVVDDKKAVIRQWSETWPLNRIVDASITSTGVGVARNKGVKLRPDHWYYCQIYGQEK
jgi:uncharacterized protein YkwD